MQLLETNTIKYTESIELNQRMAIITQDLTF